MSRSTSRNPSSTWVVCLVDEYMRRFSFSMISNLSLAARLSMWVLENSLLGTEISVLCSVLILVERRPIRSTVPAWLPNLQ